MTDKGLQERILAYVRDDAYKPLTAEELADEMQLEGEDLVSLERALESLEKDAAVIRNRHDLYGVPERMNLVVGRLSMTGKGFGFVVPENKEPEETDVFIPGSMLLSAMDGDRVVARLTHQAGEGRSREGEIIRIVEHAHKHLVGTFESSKSFGFVTPDNPKLRQDVFVPKKYFSGAKIGSKVVVEITKWPTGRRTAEGKIVEVLGMAGEPGVDVLSVMRQYDLQEEFPAVVQQAADETPQKVSAKDLAGRRDRRDLQIVTVDGEDAKDLDDGVYAEQLPHGGYFLGVYIADVSWYVRENEPLDKEARRRGTSVYLVDRVIPMLPRELSNGICSLNAGTDRLAMACEMELAPDGKVVKYEIVPAVIHVYRRLSYNIVNKILVDKDEEFLQDNADILPMLKVLAKVRDLRKKRRKQRGSIDFDLPEIKVKLDSNGHAVGLIKRTGSLAESIIEECMLAANETVAEHMDKKKLPFIYRVHEQPKQEKIEALNKLLAAFGLFVHQDKGGNIKPRDIQAVMEKTAGKPEERIINTVSLRSMQQARYAAESLGHFGLAARYYTHFTSPIRRYPDLIVHRLLRETFATGTIPKSRQERLKTLLPEIAQLSSSRERIAVEAERDTTEMKKIEYMVQFVGEEFTGVISGVTAFGIFVELDNGVEGLVHVSSMRNDYYEYVEEQYALIGEHSRHAYRLGDEVEVILARASVEERTLDFILKDNGVYTPGIRKKEKEKPALPQKKAKGGKKKKAKQGKKKLRKDELIADVGTAVWPDVPKKGRKTRIQRKTKKNRKPGRHQGRYVPVRRKTEGGTGNAD